jgi:DNA polymerase-3 subunit delta'
MLLCKNPVTENGFTDSCNLCESCRLFEAGSHADFHLIYKELSEFTTDGKGKKTPVDLPIDVIREFLIDRVSASPTLSERKVFVVSEAERLNRYSQNCLLKVLEEPPDYCTVILLCTRLEKLLPTTKSRCQIIRFGPIAEERIVEGLREMGLEQRQAQYWARLARGSMGQACQWGELELAEANLYETKKELIRSLSNLGYTKVEELAEWLLNEGKNLAAAWANLDETTSKADISRRAQKTLIRIIISALHDAMMLNVGGTEKIINFDQMEQMRTISKRFEPEQSAARIGACYKSLHWIESSVNERLVFEQLLLDLANYGKMQV